VTAGIDERNKPVCGGFYVFLSRIHSKINLRQAVQKSVNMRLFKNGQMQGSRNFEE
jgi:hypothetical protein